MAAVPLKKQLELQGLFIKEGPVVQVRDMEGKITVDNDLDPEIVYDGPLAVLVNRFSASASEIFSGSNSELWKRNNNR